jgi:UDP-glucose 4-epimerase
LTWLVTGINGYLGQALKTRLIAKKIGFVGIDINVPDQSQAVIDTICVDILELDALESFFSKNEFRGVIHLAALKDLRASNDNPDEYWKTNFIGTKNILDCVVKFNIPNFIFASTAAIYGTNATGSTDEKTRPSIDNPYASSKMAAEWLMEQYANRYEIRSLALRLFNLTGPNTPYSDFLDSGVLTKIAITNLENESFTLNGSNFSTADGTTIRDYIDVKDVAEIICLLLDAKLPDTLFEAINIGTGKGTSIKQILNEVEQVTGLPNKLVLGEKSQSDVAESVANVKKLQLLIGNYQFKDVRTLIEFSIQHLKKIQQGNS